MSHNRPIHEIRLGLVKCAIFANEKDGKTLHNVKFSRLFKAKPDDNWASSQVFGRDDLPLLTKVSDLAHTWIFVETQNGLGGSNKDRQKQSNESKKDR